ncbi:MAG: hypothetical protein IVW57_06555 [Ktedonobacterales bacterium]|nr:hypothetical protein [Ktedonobacterales bacterium]
MRLCKPDSPLWHDERAHSPLIADLLTHLFASVPGHSPSLPRFPQLYDQLKGHSSRRMCRQQRVRVYLLLGMACVADAGEGCDKALEWLAKALDLAEALDDRPALPQLFYLHGFANCLRLHYREAAEDMATCLGVLGCLAEEDALLDLALEQEAWTKLAMCSFLLGHGDLAATCYEEAAHLAEQAPERPLEAADVEWGRSLLKRWQLKPIVALSHGLTAWNLIQRTDDRAAAGRIQTIIAEIALDLADAYTLSTPHERGDHYRTLARPFAQRALALTREAEDIAGEGVAQLVSARCGAATGENVDRLPMLDHVYALGQRLGDVALCGQALTGLGREYDARGQGEQARECYRRALDTLEGTDVAVLGLWAWRGLRGLREWHLDA